jgi:hypothetical protein
MNSNFLTAFGLILVVALVASTPVENSEDDFGDQALIDQSEQDQISQSGEEEANSLETNPEDRGEFQSSPLNVITVKCYRSVYELKLTHVDQI